MIGYLPPLPERIDAVIWAFLFDRSVDKHYG
jgi:hypothetical protein